MTASDPGKASSRKGAWWRCRQQRMPAFHPQVNSARFVSMTYMAMGIGFVVVGFFSYKAAETMIEEALEYETQENEPHVLEKPLEFVLPRDVDEPIWVYYELSDLYQNHREYGSSFSAKQFQGKEDKMPSRDELKKDCKYRLRDKDDTRDRLPCGLIAASVFDDSFEIAKFENADVVQGTRFDLDSSVDKIAWDIDTHLYQNLRPVKENEEKYNMWLIEKFPPVTCSQSTFKKDEAYKPVFVKRRPVGGGSEGNTPMIAAAGGGSDEKPPMIADCKNLDNQNDMTGASCKFEQLQTDGQKEDFDCMADNGFNLKAHKSWGVESAHFLVWMRLAGQPKFRKVYGKSADKPELEKGNVLRVYVHGNYKRRNNLKSTKVVICTVGIMGSKSDYLRFAHAAIIFGGIATIFGIVKFACTKRKTQ